MASISVEPQSDIVLCKCPLEDDYKNTFTFSSVSNQTNYFVNLPGNKVLNDYTYVRKDNKIRCEIPYDQICNYNYLFYLNSGFTDAKPYYCFIDRIEYVNENCSDIYFHTDVFQTWYFQIVWNKCFVEREHVNSDTAGEHTVPEGLETGEYIQLANPTNLVNFSSGEAICCLVSDFPASLSFTPTITSNLHNGIYSGLYYCVFYHSNFTTACSWLTEFLSMYDTNAKADAVVSIFMCPQEFINKTNPEIVIISGSGDSAHKFYLPQPTTSFETLASSVSITRPTTQGGSYTPKNKKLLVYPYQYLMVTNNSGTDVVFNYEDFVSNNPSFKVIGVLSPGCSIRCVPLNYKKLSEGTNTMRSFDYSIAGGKFPICAWNSDAYTNWLTQNGVSVLGHYAGGIGALGIAGAGLLLGAVGGIAGAGMLLAGSMKVFDSLAQNYKASLLPDQARGNTSVGDVTYSASKNTFTAYKMGIKEEYARIIDDYFSTFGYKVNRVKVPNITGRTYWNFIKTIDCNADGDIPQEDLKEIRKACDHGITFWHDTTKMYDYSQSNTIVT